MVLRNEKSNIKRDEQAGVSTCLGPECHENASSEHVMDQ